MTPPRFMQLTLCGTTVAFLALHAAGCDSAHPRIEESIHNHGEPAHLPLSFPHGVTILEQRFAYSARQPFDERGKTEFREIIDWLPKMAARSNLPESEWDEISELVNDIRRATADWDTVDRVAVTQSLTILKNIAKANEDRFMERFQHSHSHSHSHSPDEA